MEIELNQLELSFESLRAKSLKKERQLMSALSEHGQQLPVVVIGGSGAERFVLIDGYKRVRALQKLGRDMVRATLWQLEAADALLLERLLRKSEGDSPLEQGWLLHTLKVGYGLSLAELGQRFEKSKSWVSRRLALVEQLPDFVQARVRDGTVCAQAAEKYLVPLARANAEDAKILSAALIELRPSVRQLAALYTSYKAATAEARTRICENPELFLRASAVIKESTAADDSPQAGWVKDLSAIAAIARRNQQRLKAGFAKTLGEAEHRQAFLCFRQAQNEAETLIELGIKEFFDARPKYAQRHLASA